MSGRFEQLVSLTLAAAAVAAVGVLAHREFGAPRATAARPAQREAYEPRWAQMAEQGIRVGPRDSRVVIMEFGDLECPFCARFHSAVGEVRKKHPADISLVFIHYPLPGHRFARPAARALECADRAGHVGEMLDVLYRKQDSLGLKSWQAYALEAGIADTSGLRRCVADSTTFPRIGTGLKLGQSIGVRATPTILINGWRYAIPPDAEQLGQGVAEILKGRPPFAMGASGGTP